MFSHYGIAGGYNNYLGGVHVCDHITQETMSAAKQYCNGTVDSHYLGGVCDHITLQRLTSV